MAVSALLIKRGLKVLILMITTVCLWLHYLSLYTENNEDQFTVGGCFITFLIIGIASLFEMYVEPFPRYTELYFHVCGVAMFLISACFCYSFWDSAPVFLANYDIVLAKAILCAFNVLFYSISGYMHYKQDASNVATTV